MKWYVLTGIAVAGTAVAAGLGYYVLKSRRSDDSDPESKFTGDQNSFDTPSETPQTSVRYTTPAPSVPASSGFPLKRGSRGEYVRNLQNALIQKYGAQALPKYGADGSWGAEVDTALKKNGLKTVIDQTTYTDYVTGNFGETSSSPNAPKTTAPTVVDDIKSILVPTWIVDPKVKTGYQIFSTAKAKNLQATLSLLKTLSNVTDYTSASKGFQLRPWKTEVNVSWTGPNVQVARYTLVTGLLDAFSSQSDKNLLRAEFRRMGLKETVKNSDPANYDSSWSLSGLGKGHRNVRTTMRAVISDGFNVRVEVPARTLLGQWLSSGNGYTRFRTHDGRDMYVRSNAIVFS
jgi:hypothetical protein